MANTVIEVSNLSKQYRLGSVGTGSLRDDLRRLIARVQGREDPFLKIGELNSRSKKGKSDYVWALNDINLKIGEGEVVGFVGKNGAGKSTLLKILSRITAPTTGAAKIRGRVGSLLEVGTGFHPELTGRENIYLNGSILGMGRSEISRKLDEIIDFSGIERYIDTPVKRYSSGMTVRLGFAVAAHLEPEILIVDEVLAVGDFEFQKKCLGRMQNISKNHGRTILFVSHNMGAISALCSRAVYMKDGEIVESGDCASIISQYFNSESELGELNLEKKGGSVAWVKSVAAKDARSNPQAEFNIDEEITIDISYTIEEQIKGLVVALILESDKGPIFYTFNSETDDPKSSYSRGVHRSTYRIPAMLLKPGSYYVTINLGTPGELIQEYKNVLRFDVLENNFDTTNRGFRRDRPGVIVAQGEWNNE